MSQGASKLIKTLRQILCVLNALLTISAVIQIVDLITKVSLRTKSKRKMVPKRINSSGKLIVPSNYSAWLPSESTNPSVTSSQSSSVSIGLMAGDIAILAITVIVGWIAIVTLKRRALHVYLVFMIIDMLFTILIIIRDASAGSWLIMCDINLAINISTLIVMYFMYKELAKNASDRGAVDAMLNASSVRPIERMDSFNGNAHPPSLPTAVSAASALASFDSIDDSSPDVSALASYLHHRRATLWSNGSLICETNLPPSYWDTSVCLSVAPLPFTISPGDPPPPWSPPEDTTLDLSLTNSSPLDTNNNLHGNNFNFNSPDTSSAQATAVPQENPSAATPCNADEGEMTTTSSDIPSV